LIFMYCRRAFLPSTFFSRIIPHSTCITPLPTFPFTQHLHREMSNKIVKRDHEGNVIRKGPKIWLQKLKAAKQAARLQENRDITIPEMVTPKSLANIMGVRTVDILKMMIKKGEDPKSAEDLISTELAGNLATEMNFTVKHAPKQSQPPPKDKEKEKEKEKQKEKEKEKSKHQKSNSKK